MKLLPQVGLILKTTRCCAAMSARKELWAQEADAEIQQQLLQVLKVNQNVQTQQLYHQQELILRDLQQARLIELRKREEYLATLAKPVKLPKVNKKCLIVMLKQSILFQNPF